MPAPEQRTCTAQSAARGAPGPGECGHCRAEEVRPQLTGPLHEPHSSPRRRAVVSTVHRIPSTGDDEEPRGPTAEPLWGPSPSWYNHPRVAARSLRTTTTRGVGPAGTISPLSVTSPPGRRRQPRRPAGRRPNRRRKRGLRAPHPPAGGTAPGPDHPSSRCRPLGFLVAVCSGKPRAPRSHRRSVSPGRWGGGGRPPADTDGTPPPSAAPGAPTPTVLTRPALGHRRAPRDTFRNSLRGPLGVTAA